MGDISAKDALLLKNILLKIIDDSESDSFSDLIEQFETNSFSAEIRSEAISLAKHAFEAAKTNNRNNKSWAYYNWPQAESTPAAKIIQI